MSTIKANTLLHSDGSTTNPPAIPALDKRMAKAWVSWTQIGTHAIFDSYGISSVTDQAVGDTYVNFTTAMTTNHYAVLLGGHKISDWDESLQYTNPLAANILIRNFNGSGTGIDTNHISLAIFDT